MHSNKENRPAAKVNNSPLCLETDWVLDADKLLRTSKASALISFSSTPKEETLALTGNDVGTTARQTCIAAIKRILEATIQSVQFNYNTRNLHQSASFIVFKTVGHEPYSDQSQSNPHSPAIFL